MRKSSCLVQGFVVIMLVVLTAYGLQRCGTSGSVAPATEGEGASGEAAPQSRILAIVDQILGRPGPGQASAGGQEGGGGLSLWPFRRATPTSAPTRPPSVIEGLVIRDKRPLSLIPAQVEGMAATTHHLFLAVLSSPKEMPMICKLDQNLYAIVQLRELPGGAGARPGALSMGAKELWLTMQVEDVPDATVILCIDPGTLGVIEQFSVPVDVRVVVESGPDELVGFAQASNHVYRWSRDGEILEDLETGYRARYQGAEAINGSLVCTGIDETTGKGVLDVVDPVSLTLLRRYRGNALADDGTLLLGKPFAVTQERFQFLAGQGEKPMLATYVVLNRTLQEYIPFVQRP